MIAITTLNFSNKEKPWIDLDKTGQIKINGSAARIIGMQAEKEYIYFLHDEFKGFFIKRVGEGEYGFTFSSHPQTGSRYILNDIQLVQYITRLTNIETFTKDNGHTRLNIDLSPYYIETSRYHKIIIPAHTIFDDCNQKELQRLQSKKTVFLEINNRKYTIKVARQNVVIYHSRYVNAINENKHKVAENNLKRTRQFRKALYDHDRSLVMDLPKA